MFKKMFEIDLLEYQKKREEQEKEQQRLSATDMALRGFKLAMEKDQERQNRKSDEEVIAILSAVKVTEPLEPPQSTEEKLTKTKRKIQV
jgi:hypothetical protein